MHAATIVILRVIIAVSLAGSLVVQGVLVPLLWLDLSAEALWGRIWVCATVVLGVACLQVFAVCVWRLLTLVRRGAVFSPAAFRDVDVIVGAVAAAAVLTAGLAVALAPGRTAPGVVALLCGGALTLGGMALLVVVMKRLLRQATELRLELDEVI
ncbi:DUF2975 domain-containing protein [Microbacterium sp. W1N]|uniref:DUF2975 domain-containing protein n=1 Tax=Microbacterium festucae TaxID=2977531 RepID=UPI0021BE8A63|nr:DUF2975 domain-containing protein [Microbacterium festucae]MCT9820929.1 DUF2975 domain-containing protein [Microbacterium festucae]